MTTDICFAPRWNLDVIRVAGGLPSGVSNLKIYGGTLLNHTEQTVGPNTTRALLANDRLWAQLSGHGLMVETGALNRHDTTGDHFLGELRSMRNRFRNRNLARVKFVGFQLDEPLHKMFRLTPKRGSLTVGQGWAADIGTKVGRWCALAQALFGAELDHIKAGRVVDLIEPYPAITSRLLDPYVRAVLRAAPGSLDRLVLDIDWEAIDDQAPRAGAGWRRVRQLIPGFDRFEHDRQRHYLRHNQELNRIAKLALELGLELQVLVGSPTSRYTRSNDDYLAWARDVQIPRVRRALGGLGVHYMVQGFGANEHNRPAGVPNFATMAQIVRCTRSAEDPRTFDRIAHVERHGPQNGGGRV